MPLNFFGPADTNFANLVNWQPAQYLVLTNGSGYLVDYYVPFHRPWRFRGTNEGTEQRGS